MSPRTKQQNEAIRQRSIATIREAALEVFAKYGYHSASITQIAKEAGVSKGLLYNYFASKEELLQSIVQEAMEANEASWLKSLESDLPPFEKLKKATENTIDLVKSNLHHWRLLTALSFQPDVFKSMEEMLTAKRVEYIQKIAELFIQMGIAEPEKEVFYFGAFLDGIFLHYMNMEEAYPLDDMKNMILERYESYAQK
ncbi:MAG: TetR/AcrR family transcriptional regulator [Saprospiraceae bacterium]